MPDQSAFSQLIKAGYTFKGESFRIGTAMLNGEVVTGRGHILAAENHEPPRPDCRRYRYGQNKNTATDRRRAEQCQVPVLLMDIKGDLSGIAAAGTENDKIKERIQKTGRRVTSPLPYPVELMTLSNEKGVRLRATVSEFGPVLLIKNPKSQRYPGRPGGHDLQILR